MDLSGTRKKESRSTWTENFPGRENGRKLFEVREDGMFYMGDYVQAEGGGLKEIRFDKVYLSEADIMETKGRRRRTRK